MDNSGEQIREKISIESPREEDANAIIVIIKEGYMETFLDEERGITREVIEHNFSKIFGPTENFIQGIEEQEDIKCFVAKRNGLIVGVLIWDENEKSNEVRGFFVKPEARGIGLFLMAAAQKTMNQGKNVALWVDENNTKARALYERLGFSLTGDARDDEWETLQGKVLVQHNLEMTRKLG